MHCHPSLTFLSRAASDIRSCTRSPFLPVTMSVIRDIIYSKIHLCCDNCSCQQFPSEKEIKKYYLTTGHISPC